MVGRGVDEPPRVNLVDDSPAFGTPAVGDAVLTAGGDRSLAPADIPIGAVSDVRHGSPSEGWILEVQPQVVTILADSGTRYQSKLFNPAFLKEKGLPCPEWL